MKKSLLIFVLLFALLLASCNTDNSTSTDNTSNQLSANPNSKYAEVQTATGGTYKQIFLDFPDNRVFAFAHNSDIYTISRNIEEGKPAFFEIWRNDTDLVFITDDTSIDYAAASGEGIWLVETFIEDGFPANRLKLIAFSGEVVRTIPLSQILENSDEMINSILYISDFIYIKSASMVFIVDSAGKIIASHQISKEKYALISGNDNNAYIVDYSGEKIVISKIDNTGITDMLIIEEPNTKVFRGNDEYCFFLSNAKGLFGLQADGEISDLLFWDECGLNRQELINLFALPTGEYLLWSFEGLSKLSPVNPSEVATRIPLVLATISDAMEIRAIVGQFNRDESQPYRITVKDYSENGTYDKNTSIMRLNTDIASGIYPDLMLFASLSPFAYINKGYLLNLDEYISTDNDLGGDSIAILDTLQINNGVYYLGSHFYIETLVGLHSDLGDKYGWTLDEYLEIEKIMPQNSETLYNTTRPQFLYQLSARYLKYAIDWERGLCDFNNDDFISILEACSRIKENPENAAAMDFTYGPVRVANKTLVASATWVNNVWKLAYEEKMAGCKLSFIGWPTVDGSSGTDMSVIAPVGICSQSSNIDGCWDFIRYMILNADLNNSFAMPVYRPHLESLLTNAIDKPSEAGVQLSPDDVKRFWDLIEEVENVSIYDENILNIIAEEGRVYFSGDKSASDTAQTIQSRVQLYVNEQK